MKKQSTITINDILYDAKAGKPLSKPHLKPKTVAKLTQMPSISEAVNKRAIHPISRDIQKSTTLNRRTALHLHKQTKSETNNNTPTIHNLAVSVQKSNNTSIPLLPKKKPLHFDITKPVSANSIHTTENTHQNSSSTNYRSKDTPLALHKQSTIQPKLESLISSSLLAAKSHLEEPLRDIKKYKKKMSILKKTASITAAVFLLAGFFAYQNMTLIAVNYAAKKSGVHASIPDYTPSGFSPSKSVSYQPGKVTVSFSSHTDSRQFSLDQQNSSWSDSDFVAEVNTISKGTYRTYEMSGKTIYFYNDSDATWIENGVWYTIRGDSKLTNQQLVSIATSI